MAKDAKNVNTCENKKCTVGGQALIEGILMRGPERTATVVRKSDGTFAKKVTPNVSPKDKCPLFGWPVIRGVVNMIVSLKTGMEAITYSASFFDEEDEREETERLVEKKTAKRLKEIKSELSSLSPEQREQRVKEEKERIREEITGHVMTEEEKLLKEKKEKQAEKAMIAGALVLSLALSLFLFFFLPTFIASLLPKGLPPIALAAIEGLSRILILILYIFFISRTKDIKRVFMYHGAEHKTIFTYEDDAELTVENVRTRSRLHPRCGTNFLFIVMIVSILVFAFVKWENVLMRFLVRIILIPVVVGISYELIMLSGKHDNFLTRMLCAPGLWLQHMTTAEPDDSMIEVAICATRLALGWDELCENEEKTDGDAPDEESVEANDGEGSSD